MKNSSASNPARTTTARRNSLKSLLTLASGAASLGALAPAAEAAVVYQSFINPATVGISGTSDYNISLPGDGNILLFGSASAHYIGAVFNGVTGVFGRQNNDRSAAGHPGVYVALRTAAGFNWNNAAADQRASAASNGRIIQSNNGALAGPGAFSTTKYLLFNFQNGSTTEYGWIGMSGATITPGTPGGMSVTFTGWAYDDSGAMIGAGVPEASNVVAGALVSALVVGHTGVRLWRKHKPAIVSQPA